MRKQLTALLGVTAVAVGTLGFTGTGAQFLDQVTGTETLNVGTFGCEISDATNGATIAGDHKSVSYTAPTIMSSAPGSAPFTFQVKNTGSIATLLKVTESPALALPWSYIGTPIADVTLAAGATHNYNTGIKWNELSMADAGKSGTATWTVSCGEVPPTIFDNAPAVVPSNLASYGPEAYSYNEWGGGVTFAGTARKLNTATVVMSSWACQSGAWYTNDCATTPGATFDVPITFNVYNVDAGKVGSLIATKTQTFAIPYRPSASPSCTGADAGKWWDGSACKNGLANEITFTFAGQVLPDTAVFGVTFNTSNSGYAPLPAGTNPTDSLNIAVYPGNGIATAASVGAWLPDNVSTFLSPRGAATMVGNSPVTNMPTGPSDDFVGNMPAVQITATN